MTFRNAVSADIDAIAGLHSRSWQQTYRGIFSDDFLDNRVLADRLAVWTSRLVNPNENQWVLVAGEKDKLQGFICVYGKDDPVYGSLVDNLHVSEEARGTGLGRTLLQRAAQWMYETYGTRHMYLWVYADNIRAREVYRHLGGQEVEQVMHENLDGTVSPALRCYWDDTTSLAGILS
ncbi:GNAT family N-acetyltransferase [Arsenicibacter rosenii]|uniref:N-acetyltransferase domain-containing protein n=1 Tax=Arsenicibacter rosenii TaxID=1750698 RepID=A0A1S2VII7_9BACT|nr:GNAT family N-acetyltransferase [Arsenicibacter rosenii]OIN58571.1 hypothetical protein BLX24_13430 [Arsenicibacter rosenii]